MRVTTRYFEPLGPVPVQPPAAELADSQSVEKLIAAICRKIHPLLSSHAFTVIYDLNFEYYFWAQERPGQGIVLRFGITPNHPRFKEIIKEAALSVYQIATKYVNSTCIRHKEESNV